MFFSWDPKVKARLQLKSEGWNVKINVCTYAFFRLKVQVTTFQSYIAGVKLE